MAMKIVQAACLRVWQHICGWGMGGGIHLWWSEVVDDGMTRKMGEARRPDFEQAMGEAFGDFLSPPVPFEDASPHECCEVIRSVVGRDVPPSLLAASSESETAALAQKFGEYFETDIPTTEQVKDAIASTLARWPVGSLDELT